MKIAKVVLAGTDPMDGDARVLFVRFREHLPRDVCERIAEVPQSPFVVEGVHSPDQDLDPVTLSIEVAKERLVEPHVAGVTHAEDELHDVTQGDSGFEVLVGRIGAR